jgi:anti-sigma B factor antagonist
MQLQHEKSTPSRTDVTRVGELAVRRQRGADMLILSLSGELDIATSDLLDRELHAAEATGPQRVVVDLAGLQFIDSIGLRTLVRAHERATGNGHQLSLRQAPRAVKRLLELTETLQPLLLDD